MLNRRPRQPAARRSVQVYDQAAARLAELYESTTFERVHARIIDLLPRAPADVLDVGAGSGRDAAALSARGYRVTAVEPSIGLMDEAIRRHGTAPIKWVEDSLPDLARLGTQRFDFILVSAVWMHLTSRERGPAMHRLATLLRPSGHLVITLRHGPIDKARAITSASSEETIAIGRHYALTLVRASDEPDVLGRSEISWSTVVFSTPETAD